MRPLPCARSQANLLQGNGGRKQNVLSAQMIHHRGNNGVTAIRACCFFKRGIGDGAIVLTPKRANPKVCLEVAEVFPARFVTSCVCGECLWFTPDLRGDEGEHVGRRDVLRARTRPGNLK